MLTKGNVSIGLETRFGPNWPGKRCGARTKTGGECQRPAVKKTGRCTRHGGKSTGPRTQAGRDKIAARHTIHGRYSKENSYKAERHFYLTHHEQKYKTERAIGEFNDLYYINKIQT